jgi:hypothetical protein
MRRPPRSQGRRPPGWTPTSSGAPARPRKAAPAAPPRPAVLTVCGSSLAPVCRAARHPAVRHARQHLHQHRHHPCPVPWVSLGSYDPGMVPRAAGRRGSDRALHLLPPRSLPHRRGAGGGSGPAARHSKATRSGSCPVWPPPPAHEAHGLVGAQWPAGERAGHYLTFPFSAYSAPTTVATGAGGGEYQGEGILKRGGPPDRTFVLISIKYFV